MDGNSQSKHMLAMPSLLRERKYRCYACIAVVTMVISMRSLAAADHPIASSAKNDVSTLNRSVVRMQIAAAPDLVPIADAATESIQSMPKIVRPEGRVLDVPKQESFKPQAEVSAPTATPKTLSSARDVQADETYVSSTSQSIHKTIDEALDSKGSISFRKTPLNEVIFLLSDLWQINIVAGESISGEVSGTFHDTPLREVLSAVLTASDYSYRKTGSSLVVLPIEQIGVNNPDFISRTVRLSSSLGEIDTTLEAAGLLLSERGQIRKIGIDSVLIIDEPSRIDRVEKLLANLSPQIQSSSSGPPQYTGEQPHQGTAVRVHCHCCPS